MRTPHNGCVPDVPDRTLLGRAFAVLGAFTAERPRLTQSELSRRTGLPLPTVFRLCGQLVDAGALERRADGSYQVGVRVWELGALAPRAHGLRQVAMPYLEDLFDATRENVQLVVREGLEALYVERLSARGAVAVVGRAGGRLPLHASSGGLVLLAHGGPELLQEVLDAGLERFTPATITDEARLRRVLDGVRRTGIVICREYLNVGTMAMAAPIRERSGRVVAAISVVVSIDADPAPLIPAMRAAASGISRRLT
ncbi:MULTISPECIES: IclR family transcriptional regulator [Rhodococcus]|uniref:IclR family transcriptional regulator n=1 Tax=Rhodococcus TaxID=1827 RepID=UPI0003E28C53|nr:IclR family transcriptional regulator [Rhodococcus aetherivorans]ANZ27727.1 IclR family transcriptional regulator [Rhodococcus sp. WB1]ETT25854.1 transcriptional regulator, IclR family [Rhodococcus rhodochrous ATCC 21198]QIX52736.1 IclR family transcriptional regulator [Rhodococcus sp. DMU1]QSE60496.1 IclR family transcriptional regulator [Rhodococcus sp. PSBB066]QSE68198.1 IclR family transcriptional regulator [Rhodococcus sp. PSBB049]USC15136.1 IclR family transcriptional regulator [Rhod